MAMIWMVRVKKGAISVIPRPAGGERLEGQLAFLEQNGIDILVSTIEEHERLITDLLDEELGAALAGLRFVDLPIPDGEPPPRTPEILETVRHLAGEVSAGRHVAVHCRGGLGRSPAVVAAVLVALGRKAPAAMAEISHIRDYEVPELECQRDWVRWVEQQMRAEPPG